MRDLAGDPEVFTRSMATRGALGGVADDTSSAVEVLDAAGYGTILIETVGVGQDEVAIARLAQTVLVVDAPGLGDDIQALKAGLVEIADILVVNKADRDGTDQVVRSYQMVMEMAAASRPIGDPAEREPWKVPVCQTVATDGSGISDLVSWIDAHRAYLQRSGRLAQKEQERVRAELEMLLRHALFARFLAGLEPGRLDGLVVRVSGRELTPYQALQELGVSPEGSDRGF
jgi:LAO/AO transport system kinase